MWWIYIYSNDDLNSITEWPTMSTWEAMGYKKVDSALVGNTSNSVICEVANDSQFPWMTFPTKLGGDSTNPIGDNCWTHNDATMRSVILGGACDGAADGPFYWASDAELLSAHVDIGCLATAFPSV